MTECLAFVILQYPPNTEAFDPDTELKLPPAMVVKFEDDVLPEPPPIVE